MKRLKDVIARKRPAARASDANDRDSVKDFSEILGERRPPQARAEPVRDPAQEELERRLMNGEMPRSKPVEPIRRADVELERLVPKDPPAPMDTYPESPAATVGPSPSPDTAPATARARKAPKAAGQAPRQERQIWDVEAAPTAPQDAAPVAGARSAGRRKAPAQAPRASAGGRVKTRILGFHADDMPPDVFGSDPRPAVASVRYPTGWLVVVDRARAAATPSPLPPGFRRSGAAPTRPFRSTSGTPRCRATTTPPSPSTRRKAASSLGTAASPTSCG